MADLMMPTTSCHWHITNKQAGFALEGDGSSSANHHHVSATSRKYVTQQTVGWSHCLPLCTVQHQSESVS